MRILFVAVVLLFTAVVTSGSVVALPATTARVTPAVVGQTPTAAFLAAEHPHDLFWGGPASDKQLTDIGLTICGHHRRGLSDFAVYQAMVGGPAMVSPAGTEAYRLGLQRVRNAVRYLCP